jgi:hypothetical protein
MATKLHTHRVTLPANVVTQISQDNPTRTWVSVSIVSVVAPAAHILIGDATVTHDTGFKLSGEGVYGAPLDSGLWAFSPTGAVVSVAGVHIV